MQQAERLRCHGSQQRTVVINGNDGIQRALFGKRENFLQPCLRVQKVQRQGATRRQLGSLSASRSLRIRTSSFFRIFPLSVKGSSSRAQKNTWRGTL